MKKFVLPVALFIFFVFVFSSKVSAEPDCWKTYMGDEYSICTNQSTKCINACPSNSSTPACLAECTKVSKLCTDRVVGLYKACVDSSKQVSKPSEAPAAAPAQDVKTATPSGATLNDWINDTFGAFNPSELQVSNLSNVKSKEEIFVRAAKITDKNMEEVLQQMAAGQIKSPYAVEIINMDTDEESLIKYPDSNEYKPLAKGKVPTGSTIKSKNNSIGIAVGTSGMVFLEPNSEVTITHEGIDKAVQKGDAATNQFYLHQGELEVKTEKGKEEGQIIIRTDTVTTVPRSHLWVSQSSGQTLVGVYEGHVVVTPQGSSKSTIVTPNGGRPGVIVVAQKLSVVKVSIAGIVLAAIFGGAVFFLRKSRKTLALRQKPGKR